MAGDVPADERVLIAPGATGSSGAGGAGLRAASDDQPATPAAGSHAEPAGADQAGPAALAAGERVLHRYGRVQVLGAFGAPGAGGQPAAAERATPRATAATDDQHDRAALRSTDGSVVATTGLAAGLDRTETLGLEAFRLRASVAYRRGKQERPRDGQLWDMEHACTDIAPPRGAAARVRPPAPPASTPAGDADADTTAVQAPSALAVTDLPAHIAPTRVHAADVTAEAASRSAGATTAPDGTPAQGDAGAAPLSSYLEGSVAVGLVLIEGPTADLQFTAAERTKVVAEVQNGLSWLAAANPAAEVSFSYDIQIVRLDRAADPSQDDLEAYWRDPTMAKLGYQANFDGVYDHADEVRGRLGTRWGYVLFVTKYPVRYFAYAAIGGPRLVATYDNDGWGPDNLDRVLAHESCHIFGAVDEYASSGCDCGGAWGRFGVPNGNCDACAAAPVDCLMRGNTFNFCRYTPAHVGWGRGAGGNPALVQAKGLGQLGNFELVTPSSFSGLTHRWENFDQPGFPWEDPFQTAQVLGRLDAVSMVQSTLQNPGPLEAVVRAGGDLQFVWRDSTGAFAWSKPTRIATGAAGTHSLIQSRYGSRGNFEMLFPSTGVGLMHMWRNHDVFGFPWSNPRQVLPELGHVDAVSLIQGSRGGGVGSLEAVVRVGTRLLHIWRDQTSAAAWHVTVAFADGVGGNPAMIESVFGASRNFEVVVPSANSGLIHYWRNNSAFLTPWSGPRPFATNLGRVDAVTMIQSTFQGHLEVVARVGDRLHQLFRDTAGTWSPTSRIA
ncbi:hypothetical protein [Pseudofrankia asymbiotica]|uniref:Uncharacterized protein n=1 Tax=Pseudofrankia asymbiotica TaxID=1834516 RepID=A0A1V2IE10_9ACTN|nr:hypothetical protein [Pseudofrankia asymbiotica]ONH31394.1 hypothetical protein BL253_09035 [Pseudofrankia asymbiotica]